MREKSIVALVLLALLSTACAAPLATAPVEVTQAPSATPGTPVTQAPFTPTSPATPETYPYPAIQQPATNPYPPAGGTPSTSSPAIPPSGYEPQAGDASLTRGEAFLDVASSQLIVIAGDQVAVEARLQGNLPTPCHQLRAVVTPADANKVISVEVYSVVDAAKICTQMLQPFSAVIPLGSYTSGNYSVSVNGQSQGGFAGSYAPQPSDAQLSRGKVILDMSQSKVTSLEEKPDAEFAYLAGTLPDPCQLLRIVLTPADAQNKINLEVYSVYDPQATCVQMIVPFQIYVPLIADHSGHYSVFANGQLLGEFDK